MTRFSSESAKNPILIGVLTFLLLPFGGCSTLEPSRSPGSARHMPYQVHGVNYYPLNDAKGYIEEGIASWYGPNFHGKLTSNREVYDMNAMTAAHKTLPFNTRVKVVNLENQAEVTVRINDRGPFVAGRIIDLSYAAAKRLKIVRNGTARVRLMVVEAPKTAQLQRLQIFAVQVAVFQNPDTAQKMQLGLENSRVQSYFVGHKQYHRVLVGHTTDFATADEMKQSIRQKGFTDAFIVVDSEGSPPRLMKH